MTSLQEFLFQQHTHILESIKLADSKATAIAATNMAVIYLILPALNESRPRKRDAAALFAVLIFLAAGVIASLFGLYPHSGYLDAYVTGGELTRPDKTIKLSQQDFANMAKNATEDQITDNLISLVYARTAIRAWKFFGVEWAIWLSGTGYALSIVILGIHYRRKFENRESKVSATQAKSLAK